MGMLENAIDSKKQGDIGMCHVLTLILLWKNIGFIYNGSTALMVEGHRSVKPAHKKLSKFDSYCSHFYRQS